MWEDPLPFPPTHQNQVQEPERSHTTTAVGNTIIAVARGRTQRREPAGKRPSHTLPVRGQARKQAARPAGTALHLAFNPAGSLLGTHREGAARLPPSSTGIHVPEAVRVSTAALENTGNNLIPKVRGWVNKLQFIQFMPNHEMSRTLRGAYVAVSRIYCEVKGSYVLHSLSSKEKKGI